MVNFRESSSQRRRQTPGRGLQPALWNFERDLTVDVKLGVSEADVVGGHVLMAGVAGAVDEVRRGRRESVTAAAAGLSSVDLRPNGRRVRAARGVLLREDGAVTAAVFTLAGPELWLAAVGQRRAREQQLR